MIVLAVLSAVVAMCALAVALWQAREAKAAQTAAKQAQEEAAAARRAVEQATTSALQAKTAAEDARKASAGAGDAAGASRVLADEAQRIAQHAVDRVEDVAETIAVERSRRGMPTFEIAPGASDEFHLSYRGGPAVLDHVTVSVVPGSRVLGLSLGDEQPSEQVDVGPLRNGSVVAFRASTGQRASAVFSVLAEPWEPVVVRAD